LKHVRYPKFNNNNEKTIDWIQKKLLSEFPGVENRFIASEKLHGSNFSIYTDGKSIKCARRNGFLEAGENFHQAQNIAEQLKPKILELYNFLDPNSENIVILFGEVTGERVQLGISYGENAVRFFDICIVSETGQKFLHFDDFVIACEKFELETVPVIQEGTLAELLKLNPEFDSHILKQSGNVAEGYVIKFWKELIFENGDERERLMLKYKCSKFDEIAHAPKKPKSLDPTDAEMEFLTGEFASCLTFSRLQAVKSKLNTKQAKNRQVMAKEMMEDVVEDLSDSGKSELDNSEAVSKKAMGMVNEFVARNIQILNFSNEEYKVYQNALEQIEKFELNDFHGEKVPNVGLLKAAIMDLVGASNLPKNITGTLIPVIIAKAKDLLTK